jgi:UDP-N-acetylmuramoyl-tripeptide--D-alanyl-D-alanine ligase
VSVPFSVADLARWTGGRVASGDPSTPCTGTSIDSRAVGPGELFVAIRGPRHDAHAFLEAALSRGAAALLVEREDALPTRRLPAVVVADTTAALGALAAGHRAGFTGPVVAITGSNGKTTTKEMCASILSVRAPCLHTFGNLNNQFGLPLTLLRRRPDDASVVVEIGMNHRGEIAPLAAIARPRVAVITNVGTAHIENLGSREEIAAEKGDLVASLGATGTAVLPADDAFAMSQAKRCRGAVLAFGSGPAADVRAEQRVALAERGFAFELVTPAGRAAVQVEGLGETTIANALAAAAAAWAAGATLDEIATGLARFRGVAGRMEPRRLPRNIILINDTYNANPQSMDVALRSLAELKGRARGLAVLGDMGELGHTAESAHRATGRLVADLGLDFLFTLGERAREIAAGALEAGMDPSRVRTGDDHAEVTAAVREVLQGDDWVLVKGSRSMRMERVVEALSAGGSA